MVIDPDLSDAELVEAVDGALAAAEAEGQRPFAYADSEIDESGCAIHLWFGAEEGEEVKAIEDPLMAANYLLYQGPDAEALEPWLARGLGKRTADQVRADLVKAVHIHPQRLMLLAFCDSRRFDAESAEFVAHCLKDPNPDIRLAAVNCAALVKWPELAGAITAALAVESDERVARTLHYALSVLG